MAIKLGILVISSIICLVLVLSTGCSLFTEPPESIQCEECVECIECDKCDVCQVCEVCGLPEPSDELFKDLGCVPVEDANEIINLTNELINELNIGMPDELLISHVNYYDDKRGGP